MRNDTCAIVVGLAAIALIGAGPQILAEQGYPEDNFHACPVPACMAPCFFPPALEGECRAPGGEIQETSYFCCCCGGSDGAFRFFTPVLSMTDASSLTWTEIQGTDAFDVIRGDLQSLRNSAGDFSEATSMCVENDNLETWSFDSTLPAPGQAFWFAVRGGGSAGGTYDSTSNSQAGTRDAEVGLSGQDCAGGL